jgi:protein-disulfide isomerase
MNPAHSRAVTLAVTPDPTDHFQGSLHAPVTLVEYGDFECPSCKVAVQTPRLLLDRFPNRIRFIFRHFPLQEAHPHALLAAEVSETAGAQGKFWQMHDKMFANQQALDRPSLEKYAGEIGLDVGKFKADLDSGKYKDAINKDVEYAKTVNVNGTPAFFVNGHFINGAMPYENFAQVIDEELKKKHK